MKSNCWDSVYYLAEQFQPDSWQSKWLIVFGEGCLENSILKRSEAVGKGRICGLKTFTEVA